LPRLAISMPSKIFCPGFCTFTVKYSDFNLSVCARIQL
jgi:hypothetical protein